MTATSNSSKSAKEMFHSAGIDHALQANDYRERILKDGATPENFKQHRWYPNYKFHSDESVRNLHKYHAIKIKEDESEDFEDIDFNDSMEDLVYDKLSDRSQDIGAALLDEEAKRGYGYHPRNPKIDYYDKDRKYIASTNWAPTHIEAGKHKPDGAVYTAADRPDSKFRKIKNND